MELTGLNYVRLRGKITKAKVRRVGQYNSLVFNALLAIPAPAPAKGAQYIKISSFSCADALEPLENGTFVQIEGHIEERFYSGKCRYCGGYEKKYWTEVVVDNFIVLEE